jgi:hypothetical protein
MARGVVDEEDPMSGSRAIVGSAPLAVLSLVAAACLVTTAEASTVQVLEGTLTITQAPGESTLVRLQPPFHDMDATGPQEAPGTWTVLRNATPGRPGTRPTAGPGCTATPYPPHDIRCLAVTRVDIAFGDGADTLFMESVQDPKVAVRISGGDGDDDLYAAIPPGDVTVDGGPGNDTITTGNATVLGGPGDDTIALSWNPEDHTSPVIGCGPGNDHFADGSTLPASVRPTIDAATCPPILRALGRFRRATNGFFTAPTFKVPANRRLRLALFRAAEPVSGRVRFRAARGKSSCGKSVAFHAAAGQQVRVMLTVLPSVRRRLDTGREMGCGVTVTGTDDEGEPISGGTPYAYLLLAP